jgi:hypothetical protein
MKKIFAIASLLSLVSQLSFAAGYNGVHKNARQASGFDKLSGTNVTDCAYIVGNDGIDSRLVTVGVNSKSAPSNNVFLRIPQDSLPLQDGFTMTDIRGYKISYNDGILSAKRKKNGEGSANEKILVKMEISADLQQISSAQVQKLEGLIFKNILSQMECEF